MPVRRLLVGVAGGEQRRLVEGTADQLEAELFGRDTAFRSNEGGWTIQMQNIAQYLEQHA